jgi:hypothetical protein
MMKKFFNNHSQPSFDLVDVGRLASEKASMR